MAHIEECCADSVFAEEHKELCYEKIQYNECTEDLTCTATWGYCEPETGCPENECDNAGGSCCDNPDFAQANQKECCNDPYYFEEHTDVCCSDNYVEDHLDDCPCPGNGVRATAISPKTCCFDGKIWDNGYHRKDPYCICPQLEAECRCDVESYAAENPDECGCNNEDYAKNHLEECCKDADYAESNRETCCQQDEEDNLKCIGDPCTEPGQCAGPNTYCNFDNAGEGDGKCVPLVDKSMNWYSADSYCKAKGSSLKSGTYYCFFEEDVWQAAWDRLLKIYSDRLEEYKIALENWDADSGEPKPTKPRYPTKPKTCYGAFTPDANYWLTGCNNAVGTNVSGYGGKVEETDCETVSWHPLCK